MEYEIVIAMPAAKAVKVLRDALAAAETAENGSSLSFDIYGRANSSTGPQVTKVTISNEDMEDRPEVADDIIFDIEDL